VRPTLFSCAALALFGLPSRADDTTTASETLVRLTVTPAPAPKPALRYQLLPELKEMNPGNPIQNYLKCFMEQQKFFFDKDSFERREKLLAMPLKELSVQELRDYGGLALRQADWAARLDHPDWQILLKVKTDGVALLLPDLQEIRTLAKALKVRFRSEIALSRLDDAIRTAKTMFAMSRHSSEHPTLIGNVIGMSIANLTIDALEEMLEHPRCPNLYWGLTNLPTPMVPLDKGMGGERALVLSEFRGLDENTAMNADELTKFIEHADLLLGDGKPPKPGESRVRAWLDARTKDDKAVNAARRRLVECGLADEHVERFPADQVILLDEKREYDERIDDVMKIVHLPPWQSEALAAQFELPHPPALFADALIPGVSTVHPAQTRLDQRIALLRHIEAVRLYAAEHNGALPSKLADFTLPLPDDPFTGKPFRYELDGETVHLRGTPPPTEQRKPAFNLHYEVTVKK
jgi:hypothetical protein